MSAKPGRNDPCPCGSGRKYKRCCLVREDEAARERARQQTLFDDEIERDQDEDWLDTDDPQYEIVDEDWPSLDVRTISLVRYTRGMIRKLADLRRSRGLRVTEWEAPDIPQAILDSIEQEDLVALEGEWGDAARGDPIQVDQIDIEAGDDIFSIDVFNRAICLATTDNDEMRRIHRVCETLSAAAPDDRRRRGSNQTISQKVEIAVDWASLAKQHQQQPGTCSLCEVGLTRRNSRTHFKTCAPAHDTTTGAERALVHLQATAPGFPAYWLDIEAGMDATLEALDSLLRHDWVECCGHLSMFAIGSMNYYSRGYSLKNGPFQLLGRHRPAERRMTTRLIDVLAVGDRFRYEYDFGSTTVVDLKVISTRTGRLGRTRPRVLARNAPPVWPCATCGGSATVICPFCYANGRNPFVCRQHRRQHACGEREGFLPVVNSPRMGVCGYGG